MKKPATKPVIPDHLPACRKVGQKIFDPMMGSQSSRIAAYDMGFDYYGCEKDEDYFRDGCARFEAHIKKPVLFAPEQMYFKQEKLFE